MKNGFYVSLVLTALISFGFSACGKGLYDYAKKSERGKSGLVEKSVQVGDHKIVYLEAGEGETMLLVHGFGGDKDNWTRFAAHLGGSYRIIALDLPGFGDSSRINSAVYDIDTQTTRVKNFAKTIGISKFHIAGNSMGGWIAANYAVKYPGDILTLTLVNSAGVKTPEKSELVLNLENGFNPLLVSDVEDYDRLMKFVFVKPPYIPGSVKKVFAEAAVRNKNFNDKIFTDISKSSLMEKRLSDIKAPALVIWGDSDRVINVSGAGVYARGIKNSRTYILKECGHIPIIERPEESAGVFLKFITGRL